MKNRSDRRSERERETQINTCRKKKRIPCQCAPLTGRHLSHVALRPHSAMRQTLTPSGFRQSRWWSDWQRWGERGGLHRVSGSRCPLAALKVGYTQLLISSSASLAINSLVPLQLPLLFLPGCMLRKGCHMFIRPEILCISAFWRTNFSERTPPSSESRCPPLVFFRYLCVQLYL